MTPGTSARVAALPAWSPYVLASLLACALGVTIALGGPRAAALAAGLVAVAVVLARRPEFALLAILVGTSSVFAERHMPRLSIGIGHLYPTDVLLAGLLLSVVLRALLDRRVRLVRTPLDVPMLGFVGWAALSTVLAVASAQVDRSMAVTEGRYLGYFLLFFAVTQLVRDRRALDRLVIGMAVLAAGVTLMMVWQYFQDQPFAAGRVEHLVTGGQQYADITRMRLPGEPLLVTAFLAAAAALLSDRVGSARMGRLLACALFASGLVLTFDRSVWAGVGLALLLLLYLLGRGRRLLGLLPPLAIAAAVIVLVIQFAPKSTVGRVATAALERVRTLVTAEALASEQDTWQWRRFEYRHAVPQVFAHPLLGLGLGARYRPYVPGVDWEVEGPDAADAQREGYDGRAYLHNGHLWLLLKTGIPGYLCFVWLMLRSLRRGLHSGPRLGSAPRRGVVLGIGLAHVAMLIAAVALSVLMEWPWIAVIGATLGVSEVALRLEGRAEKGATDARR
jgi:hypothetical protein